MFCEAFNLKAVVTMFIRCCKICNFFFKVKHAFLILYCSCCCCHCCFFPTYSFHSCFFFSPLFQTFFFKHACFGKVCKQSAINGRKKWSSKYFFIKSEISNPKCFRSFQEIIMTLRNYAYDYIIEYDYYCKL